MQKPVGLNQDDIVTLDKFTNKLPFSPTFRVKEFAHQVVSKLAANTDWAEDGMECQALNHKTGGWKHGKVRVSLEFIPDEDEEEEVEVEVSDEASPQKALPPSLPDDLRQKLESSNNQ